MRSANRNNFILLKLDRLLSNEACIMKEVCKRCKKHKELAILKPRLCHDCVIAEGKSKDLSDKEKTNPKSGSKN